MPAAATASIAPETTTGLVIIGGGPVGLSIGVACRRQQIPFEIIEAGQLGNTIAWWAPQTRWFSSNERISIAGVPLQTPDQSKATREQYLTYLRSVAKQFHLRVRTFERATEFQPNDGGWTVVTSRGETTCKIDCRAVVLACGGTDRPRRLGIEGEQLSHVDAYLRDPHRYFGRRVLIVGGRNSAVEGALRLHHAGARVALSYRHAELPKESIKYWLWPELEGLMRAGAIEPHLGTQPTRITSTAVSLQATTGPEAGKTYDVAADDVLTLIGYEQDKTLFRKAGVELTDSLERPVFDEQTMQTNISGIYVAGTAVGGTQTSHYKVFLENCHDHVGRIVNHLLAMHPEIRQSAAAASGAEPEGAEQLAAQIEAQPES